MGLAVIALSACGGAATAGPPRSRPAVQAPAPAAAADPGAWRERVRGEHPLWRHLSPGPHAVGFRREVRFSALLRRETAEGEQPWASVLGIWYPAEATAREPMAFGDHLRFGLEGTEASWLEPRFRAHHTRIVRRDVFDAELGASPAVEERLAALLRLRSLAVEGAPPERGPFPVVFWHPGADAAVTEGVILGELLASHGFVVATAAFPNHGAPDLGSSDLEASLEDTHALFEVLQREPWADVRRAALVGHSLGAQRALTFGARKLFPRAIVSLDSTWDHERSQPWPLTVPEYQDVKARAAAFGTPLLAFAGAGASFTLLRSLAAPRWLVTAPALEHDDYTYHGALAAAVEEGPGSPRLRGLRATYMLVLGFLRAQLSGDAAARVALDLPSEGMLRAFDASGGGLVVERLPGRPGPTAGCLVALALRDGGEVAAAACRAPSGGRPLCDGDDLLLAAGALVAEHQGERALPLLALAIQERPRDATTHLAYGEALLDAGKADAACERLRAARPFLPPLAVHELLRRSDARSREWLATAVRAERLGEALDRVGPCAPPGGRAPASKPHARVEVQGVRQKVRRVGLERAGEAPGEPRAR